jgi:hypothetical protein
LWIFSTAAVTYRLKQISVICQQFEQQVNARLQEFGEDAKRALEPDLAVAARVVDR